MADEEPDAEDQFLPRPGAAEAPIAAVDPASLFKSLTLALASTVLAPVRATRIGLRFGERSALAGVAAAARLVGMEREGPARPTKGDRRFDDLAFQQNPAVLPPRSGAPPGGADAR